MFKPVLLVLIPATVLLSANVVVAQTLSESNYDQLVPAGKEIDAIYGDHALHNGKAKAVIAQPVATRNANMTVRTIGGSLIDLAATAYESDQLSAFYPGRRKFPFTQATSDGDLVTVISKGSAERPECRVQYRMVAEQPVVEVISTWTNTTSSDQTLVLEDDIRADGGKEDMIKSPNGTHDLFFIHDIYWQQAYGVRAPGHTIRSNSNSRESVLTYEPADGQPAVLKPGETYSLTRQLIVARDLPEVYAVNDELTGRGTSLAAFVKMLDADERPIAGARVTFRSDAGERGTTVTNAEGVIRPRLPIGDYRFDISAAGVNVFEPNVMRFVVHEGTTESQFRFEGYRTGTVQAKITDAEGRPIPAKVEFKGNGDTPSPNWGPETAEYFVRNLAYTSDGTFETVLVAGEYDVIVSHGPEYDAVFTKLKVESGKTATLRASLRHSVKTPGWVSSDFHSHSSPSGDNTGSQKGRVLNLAAEQIEFAPCTEHNRVSTYEPHIYELGLKSFLATVSGMELTGQPLPLNHQNVFPMKHTPRTQDGGGPVTDSSPETQIERIALWDDRSEKLIQQNHPDMGWLFFDKNGDGEPDGGYSRSFELMDVMEIHPIDRILDRSRYDIRNGKAFNNNRVLNWLQLLNQGFRIYGVVNTDAHYNYHGSGWLRNWIQSGTDDPAQIDPMEMVRASEQGRLIMSNGPYLEATFRSADGGKAVVSGQDLAASDGKVTAHIRVQCANWLDVDTVFVLVNGKVVPEYQFSRDQNPDLFSDDVVKFDQTLQIELTTDSHLVVATGHRTETLGDVMGPSGGAQHPAALSNPVFVDIDGDGFKPNKDTLGYPLPVKFGTEK
ncbi:MAG: CehA/McbA family metallohydrolase [Fuerstiella sp.]